jgi:RNA polymerase sigma factor (sigma-70 family)
VQRRDWIDALLEKLKPREAEVVRLRWLQGLSFEEIGASWQKTPGAVQRFYSRVWEKLSELAKEEQGREQGTMEG